MQHVFDESPFFVPDNSVSIMNDTKEGSVCPPLSPLRATHWTVPHQSSLCTSPRPPREGKMTHPSLFTPCPEVRFIGLRDQILFSIPFVDKAAPRWQQNILDLCSRLASLIRTAKIKSGQRMAYHISYEPLGKNGSYVNCCCVSISSPD